MGIQVEFNPDLALRAFGTEGRSLEECLPEKLEKGKKYKFLKKGQRNFWLDGPVPLLETKGNQRLSRPLASIKILEYTHKKFSDQQNYTTGVYLVIDIFNPNDPTIHFESYKKLEN